MKSLIILFTAATLLHSCSGNQNPDEFDASVHVHMYIESQLISPSSIEYIQESVVKIDNHTYEVFGEFNAQNSFGTLIRSNYSCKIKYSENFNTYRIEDFELN